MSGERRRLTLDTLAKDPALARALTPAERAGLVLQLAGVLAALAVDLVEAPAAGQDRLLTVREVALQTQLSRDYIYRHGRTLPFFVDVNGARALRFSAAKLAQWMADGRPAR